MPPRTRIGVNVDGEPRAAASGNHGINDHDPEKVIAFAARVCRPEADALLAVVMARVAGSDS
jgi:hypothetical protein